MKKMVILLVSLGLMACGSSSRMIQKEHTRLDMQVKIHLFDTRLKMNNALNKRHPQAEPAEGLAMWYINHDNLCEIWLYTPDSSFDLDTWGHELAHCVYGDWHG